jgi:HK97 family phage major capsid protein
MKTQKDLLEKRGLAQKEVDTLGDILSAEKRGFTPEERSRLQELKSQIEGIDADIQDLQDVEQLRSKKVPEGINNFGAESKGEEKELRKMANKFSLSRAAGIASGEIRTNDGVELEFSEMGKAEMRASGITNFSGHGVQIPSHLLVDMCARHALLSEAQMRTMTVTGGTPVGVQGGYNVQTDVMGILEVLKPYMALARLGTTKLSGLVGNLAWPVSSTGYTGGGYATENGTATEIRPAFTEIQMTAKRFAAFIEVSNQLFMQSNNSIDRYVLDLLLTTLAVRWEQAAIKGGGSNEPTGIIANTSVTVKYAGNAASNSTNPNGAAMKYKDALNMLNVINNNNAMNPEFLGTFNLMAKLQDTPKQTSGVEGNFIIKDTDKNQLAGYRIDYSNNVPNNLTKGSTGTGLSALIAGEFKHLILGSWGGVELIRDSITGAKNAKTTLILNSWGDALVSRPEAFVVIKDIVTT